MPVTVWPRGMTNDTTGSALASPMDPARASGLVLCTRARTVAATAGGTIRRDTARTAIAARWSGAGRRMREPPHSAAVSTARTTGARAGVNHDVGRTSERRVEALAEPGE